MGFGSNIEKNPIFGGILEKVLERSGTAAQINQIKGTSVAGSNGAGIPKQVSNVSASVSNATAGATSVLKVTFRRDPSDQNFSKADVYLRGYCGNNANVLVASGADSPITCLVNNTGESIVVTVNAAGNSGSAPIASSPTTGVKLPKGAAGGFGSTTVIAPPTQMIGDVNTTGTASPLQATVIGLRTVAISAVAPAVGDILQYSENADSKWDLVIPVPRFMHMLSDGGSTTPYSVGWSSAPVSIGSKSLFAATATEPGGVNVFNISGVGSTSDIVCLEQVFGASTGSLTYGCFRRFSCRLLLGAGLGLTNSRFWWGLTNTAPQFGTTAYSTNTYGAVHPCAAFRYCNGTDTNIQAVCGNGAAQTVVDTGIPPDTSNSQVFDIVRDGSTHFRFFINGVLVGTISATMPAATDLWGHGIIGDNQNHANNIGFTHFWSAVTVK